VKEYISKFHSYAQLLHKRGAIEDIEEFKNDISAFLLHMSHLKAYDFSKPFCSGKRVLEIGCNTGYGTIEIADAAQEVVALDSDPSVLQVARKSHAARKIRYEDGKASYLPYEPCSFDVVLAFQVIEHVNPSEVPLLLSEIDRVLKDDGIAIITTPNRKLRLYPFQKPFNPEHFIEYTSKKFYRRLKVYFDKVKILGLRAEKWIEEIEKIRIDNSLIRAYLKEPVKRFLKIILTEKMKKSLKKKSPQPKFKLSKIRNDQLKHGAFTRMASKFSMDCFRFEDSDLDNALYLMSIYEKNAR
jgi:ubiquinone/menaquinone biosynthesis C-methylase UbiE